MAYSKDNPYNEKLEENKERYNKGELTKDQYQAKARTFRRNARDWERRNDPSGTAPVKKKRKTSTRKKKVEVFNVDHEAVITTMLNTFEEKGITLKEIDLNESFHAVAYPNIIKAAQANPDVEIGQGIIDKFKARWFNDPEWYGIYQQGDVNVLALGPIITVE